MIHLLYAQTTLVPDELGVEGLSLLPAPLRARIGRFRRPLDRKHRLLALMLLEQAYEMAFNRRFHFDLLTYDPWGRPLLLEEGIKATSRWDFNWSHSGDYVVLAHSFDSRVGLDIERIGQVNLDDFSSTMSTVQWQRIRKDPRPLERFFSYWTAKESAMKADGRGLGVPLQEIEVESGLVTYQGCSWNLLSIGSFEHHCCHLAYQGPQEVIMESFKVSPRADRSFPGRGKGDFSGEQWNQQKCGQNEDKNGGLH